MEVQDERRSALPPDILVVGWEEAEGARRSHSPSTVPGSLFVLPPDIVVIHSRKLPDPQLPSVADPAWHVLLTPVLPDEAAALFRTILRLRQARIEHLRSLAQGGVHSAAQRIAAHTSVQRALHEAAVAFQRLMACDRLAAVRWQEGVLRLELLEGFAGRRSQDLLPFLRNLAPSEAGPPSWKSLPRNVAKDLGLPAGKCLAVPVGRGPSFVFLLFWSEGPREPGRLLGDAQLMAAALAGATERARHVYRAELANSRDPWTGLPGPAWLLEAVTQEFGHRPGPFYALEVDIRGFQTLNERHGHRTGGRALVETAKLLSAWAGPWLCRTGPDSFVAVFQERVPTELLGELSRGRPLQVEGPLGAMETVPVSFSHKVFVLAGGDDLRRLLSKPSRSLG